MEGNSLTSFENLCRIFEMRIKLDREKGVKTTLDVLSNYEKYSKKIDSVYNTEFQKEIKPFISPGVTLEKEKDRLRRLIKLLEDRLERRIELEDRYYNTTGKYISGLQMIVSEEELNDKKDRLSVVSRYLETNEEIENVTESINELKKLLSEEENKKEEYEKKNKIMEDELYSSFMNVIKNDEYYKNINEEEINDELDNIKGNVLETKETLDITKESVGSLMTSGLEDDYASYVEEAERSYYNYKNKEIILKIYKLVTVFEDDFKLIYAKREKINELILEKKELSENLIINVDNELISFEKTLLLQCNTLDNEKETLDNINNYVSRIDFKEERLEELNEVNSSVEILALLREYGLIETYDTEDTVLEDAEEEYEVSELEIPSLEVEDNNVDDEIVVKQEYDPYRIVEVTDYPITLNVGLAKLKGESVREKVNKKLNPKKEEEVTFEDINVELDEKNVSDKNDVPELNIELPSVVDNTKVEEVNIPAPEEIKEEPVKEDDMVVTSPVWELPTEMNVKPISSVEEKKEDVLPVWGAITPEFEETKTSNNEEISSISINDKPEEKNNLFWIPVSETKVNTNSFPNLNMSVNNNLNKNSEFIFPTINN